MIQHNVHCVPGLNNWALEFLLLLFFHDPRALSLRIAERASGGSYEAEKTANDGIWILTTISKRFYLVPGSKKGIENANPGGWMDGNSWGVATRAVREYALLISGVHWSITSWFQRSALPLPVSWTCVQQLSSDTFEAHLYLSSSVLSNRMSLPLSCFLSCCVPEAYLLSWSVTLAVKVIIGNFFSN